MRRGRRVDMRHMRTHQRESALRAAAVPADADRRVGPPELAAVELFASLPQPALADLARHARTAFYAAGTEVFCEGAIGDCLHVVRSGAVKVVRPSHDPDVVLDVLAPGKVFGELSVLNSSPRTATLVDVADTTAVVV